MSNQKFSTTVTITGVGVGLPGPDRSMFSQDNIDRLLAGHNFISKISRKKMELQKRQNIIQKSIKDGEVIFRKLHEDDDLIKLAGEAGEFDLVEEYGIGHGLADAWEITTKLAIAAGLEALKDAKIPLLSKNGKLSLPEEMVDDTGIIFASTFPVANTLLEEQRKFHHHRSRVEKQILADKLKKKLGPEAACIIDETFYTDEAGGYNFDRKYLLKAIPIQSGNFAQVINAKGPNTGINSACASTTQAIAMAEDWIKLGRCKRVIVIAADDPTNDETFHWIATGFLAAGAATTAANIEQGAKPFDRYRSGMILGTGAVGIVLEAEEEVQKRGVNPIAEILGSHFANSAFHGTRMHPDHVKSTFKQFMVGIIEKYGLTSEEIANSCLYMIYKSHFFK